MDSTTIFYHDGNYDPRIPSDVEKIRTWLLTNHPDSYIMQFGQPYSPLMVVTKSIRPNSILVAALLLNAAANINYLG